MVYNDIWNPGNFACGIRILGFGIRNVAQGYPECHQRLEWGIHDVEFRSQDCLGFPYMGRQGDALTPDIRRNWNSLITLYIWAALLAMKMALKSRRSQ